MTANLIAFDSLNDLINLTGLSKDMLWAHGFDLDDWDIGFQSDIDLSQYDGNFWWLTSRMENYCVGPTYTNYQGKHYYIVHHA